jgi:hypothetical protein
VPFSDLLQTTHRLLIGSQYRICLLIQYLLRNVDSFRGIWAQRQSVVEFDFVALAFDPEAAIKSLETVSQFHPRKPCAPAHAWHSEEWMKERRS